MLKGLFMLILNIFGIKTETTETEVNKNEEYKNEYEQIDEINFDAIFSNKIANYTVSDSSIFVDGGNKRADLLNMIAQSMWRKFKKITSMAEGYGGVILVPYVKKGKIFYNIVPQNRITIDETTGDLITKATLLAEEKVINSMTTKTTYYRWTNYQIANNNLVITQKFTNKSGKEVETPEFWKDIQQVMKISNVDRVPFGYIKSTTNNRKINDKYGVPITYGCESTINEIRTCLKQIADEYSSKEVKIFVDSSLLGKDKKVANTNIFPMSGEDNFYQVFDSAIRDSSYYVRLQELFARLEREVGTSSGILTEMTTTNNATATEIKRTLYATFTIVSDMRMNIEKGLEDFFYSCNILANAYNLTPNGTYEINYTWDYSLLEDSQETFNQYVQGVNQGVIKREELRNWIMSGETMEESEKAILEIKEQNPTVQDLLGTGGEE